MLITALKTGVKIQLAAPGSDCKYKKKKEGGGRIQLQGLQCLLDTHVQIKGQLLPAPGPEGALLQVALV